MLPQMIVIENTEKRIKDYSHEKYTAYVNVNYSYRWMKHLQ